MALASQSIRPVRVAGPGPAGGGTSPRSNRPWWSRPRTPAQNAMLAGAALVGIIVAVWGINRLTSGPKSVEAANGAPAPVSPVAPAPDNAGTTPPNATSSLTKRETNPPQAPVTPPVVVDSNGRRVAQATPPATNPASTPTNGSNPPSSPGSTPTGTGSTPPSPAGTTPPPAAPEPASEIQQWITAAERARQEGRLLEARTLLNKALMDPRTQQSDKVGLRTWIGELNETLVFGPAVTKGDVLTDTYAVQSGDSLVRIAARQGLGVDYRFIQRINKMSDPGRLSVGQKLKVVRGPFHVVVDKSDFRMDVYAGPPPSPGNVGKPGRADGAENDWVFIKSFRVGLGEHGLTPVGSFIVKPRSKLVNPPWVNPRTGEKFGADDAKNPIGERWMGLEGVDDQTRTAVGYGIHGTIDPSSIGKEMSMGCVRMAGGDVEVVWEMLQEGVSVVRIMP